MNIKQLIEYLEKKDPYMVVPMGFAGPHSYRGDYECVAFEPRKNVTIGGMLDIARDALGSTYQGWKGGDYRMNMASEVYLAAEGCSGEKIGRVLLDYMTCEYESGDQCKANLQMEEYRNKINKLIVEKGDMEYELMWANREIPMLRDTIKDYRNGALAHALGIKKVDDKIVETGHHEICILEARIYDAENLMIRVGEIFEAMDSCDLSVDEMIDGIKGVIDEMPIGTPIQESGLADEIKRRDEIIESISNKRIDELQIIEGLKDKVKSLETELTIRNVPLMKEFLKSSARLAIKQDDEIDVLNDRIIKKALESQKLRVELSARKQDSEVLLKVVDAIRRYYSNELIYAADVMRLVEPLIKDYLDAPEGPPDATVSMKNRTSVTVTWLDLP